MKNLRNSESVHIWHSEPSTEDVYEAFLVYEQVSNFPCVHFITAPSLDEAIQDVYVKIAEEEGNYDDIVLSGVELAPIDQLDVEYFKKLNHEK